MPVSDPPGALSLVVWIPVSGWLAALESPVKFADAVEVTAVGAGLLDLARLCLCCGTGDSTTAIADDSTLLVPGRSGVFPGEGPPGPRFARYAAAGAFHPFSCRSAFGVVSSVTQPVSEDSFAMTKTSAQQPGPAPRGPGGKQVAKVRCGGVGGD